MDRLRDILGEHRIELKTIRGTSDIWCRDYLPVQIDMGEFARFRYAPDHLRDREVLITDYDRLAPIPEVETCRRSDIVLDGGNVVGWGRRCILTDKIYRENAGIRRADLRNVLRELLEVHDLIVIPRGSPSPARVPGRSSTRTPDPGGCHPSSRTSSP
jgi:hypothetical protein